MKKNIRDLLLGCILLGCMIIPVRAQGGMNMEWISVDGNSFFKRSGEPIVFRGVNIRDPHELEKEDHWAIWHFQEAKNWGANVIRIPVHPASWRERGQEGYLELLDQAVEWAKALELYLILDWHSIGNLKQEKFHRRSYVTTFSETYDFWDRVSARYVREPVVAMYELFNEPTVSESRFGEMSWKEWKEMNEQLIRVIRNNHPRAVVLVAGLDWGYDLTQVGKDPVNARNIAYVSHPYPQKVDPPWEARWEADWGYVARDYPVILTEIGFALPEEKGVHVPVEGDETYGRALVDFAGQRGISWVVWCFDPDYAPYMFTDWDYSPTRQGEFFRRVMREAN